MARTKTKTGSSLGLVGFFCAATLAGWGVFACGSDETGSVLGGTGGMASTTTSGGGQTSTGIGGGEGGFTPEAGPCQGHADDIICDKKTAIACDGDGKVASETDCGDELCVPEIGCVLCLDGQFACEGNDVLVCNTGPPPQWDPLTTCDPLANQKCNPTTGTCDVLTPIGNESTNPTGTYYQYALYTEGSSPFLGGCDIDSLGNYLYVNQGAWYVDGHTLDVYKIELLDSDGDGEFEPNQHPDNPDKPGPIEERVLTHVTSYPVSHLGMVHHSEVYAVPGGIFLLDAPANPGMLFKFDFGTQVTTPVISGATPSIELAQLGYDAISGTWYGSSEAARKVYSYHADTNAWVAEFLYPNMAGGHMDGLEVVTNPNTGVAYVYVSDMTSDFLGQYRRDRGGSWVQENLFEYLGTGGSVEGMGFGAFNHFWITSGATLYEVGGGDLSKYLDPDDPPPT